MKKTINDLYLEKIIKIINIPILVDFWAPWCTPCKVFENIINNVYNEFKDKIKLIKINIDYNYNTCEKYSIRNIPTIILIRKRSIIKRKHGIISREYVRGIIKKVI